MDKGFLLVVSGPAGVGKGTICNEVIDGNEDIFYSISYTTRKPRAGEVDGVNYNFTDEETFKEMVKENKFLEYAHVHTNYYGTPRKYIEDKINEGKIVLLEIDVQGAIQVMNSDLDVVSVFILPPSMRELKSRIVNRNTETKEDINRRMKNAYGEIENLNKYDYFIINDDLDIAIQDLQNIVDTEKKKVNRNKGIEEKYLEEEI